MIGLRRFKVDGNSMSPRYQHGDYVISWRGCRPRYRPGDIIVLDHPQLGIVVKRILNTRQDHHSPHPELLLTGENAQSSSPESMGWQPAKAVLGKVIWHIAA